MMFNCFTRNMILPPDRHPQKYPGSNQVIADAGDISGSSLPIRFV
jgi:hypothetical protein